MPAPLRHRVFVAIARAVILTILITLLAFAVSLFLAIVGIVLVAMIRGGGINMAIAYRHIALPFALVVLCVTLVYMLVGAVRDVRGSRATRPPSSRAA